MSATDTRVLISADAQCAIQRWGKEHEAKFSKVLNIVTLFSEYTRFLTFENLFQADFCLTQELLGMTLKDVSGVGEGGSASATRALGRDDVATKIQKFIL